MARNKKFAITTKEGYLEVRYQPGFILTDESSKELTPEILSKCKETGLTRILVLTGETLRQLSPVETINSAERALKNKIQGFKFAVVKPGSEISPDARFTEHVAENRGIFVKYFSEEETAMRWLME